MSKRSKSKRSDEFHVPVPRGLWSELMGLFTQSVLHCYYTHYLDIPNLKVLSIRREDGGRPKYGYGEKPPEWKLAMREAEDERVRARLRDSPHTLVEVPYYSSKDEESDWRDFLQRFPSEKYRKQLHQARREFNGGPRDLLNRLSEDYPKENDQWREYRERKKSKRLAQWLEDNGALRKSSEH